MVLLSLEYILLIVVGTTGVVQAAAAYNGLRGLLFFRRRLYTILFTFVTVVPVLIGLFTWNYYNPTGIIEGAQQFVLFVLGFIITLVITLAASSWLNQHHLSRSSLPGKGLEALKEDTFFRLIRWRLGRGE